jgi:hypothetical protein
MKRIILYTLLFLTIAGKLFAQDPLPASPTVASIQGYYKIVGGDTIRYIYQSSIGWMKLAGRTWVDTRLNGTTSTMPVFTSQHQIGNSHQTDNGTVIGATESYKQQWSSADGSGYLHYDNLGNHIFSLTRQSNDVSLSAFNGVGLSGGNLATPGNTYGLYVDYANNVHIYNQAWANFTLPSYDFSTQIANSAFVKNLERSKSPYFSDYIFTPTYGQSNSNSGGLVALYTVSQPYSTTMPRYGVFAVDPGTPIAPLVKFAETVSETPLSGITQNFASQFYADTHIQWQSDSLNMVAAACGVGGHSISQLSYGTADYARLINTTDSVLSIANNNHQSFSVPYIFWIQGETDVDANTANYNDLLGTLINNVSNSIKAIDHQQNDIPFISPQLAYGITNTNKFNMVAGVQNIFNDLSHLFTLACPSYQFWYSVQTPDTVHLTPASRRHMGGYLGLAAEYQTVHKSKFQPLSPVNMHVSGNTIQVTFNVPVAPLVIDTTDVTNPNNQYGFSLRNGSSTIAISNIHVLNNNTITMEAASSPVGDTLYYAVTPASSPVVSGDSVRFRNRGCLHDSQLIKDPYDGYTYYNWCLMFKMPVIGDPNAILYTNNGNASVEGSFLVGSLSTTTPIADASIASAPTWNSKQNALTNGTGVASLAGGTISIGQDVSTGANAVFNSMSLTQGINVGNYPYGYSIGGSLVLIGDGTDVVFFPVSSGGVIQWNNFARSAKNMWLTDAGDLTLRGNVSTPGSILTNTSSGTPVTDSILVKNATTNLIKKIAGNYYAATSSGTWTPASSTVTLTVNDTYYQTVGGMTTAFFNITFPVSASLNSVAITGLPTAPYDYYPLSISVNTSGLAILGQTQTTDSTVLLTDNSNTAITYTQMSGKTLAGSVTYRIFYP